MVLRWRCWVLVSAARLLSRGSWQRGLRALTSISEIPSDLARLSNPYGARVIALGLIVIDEVQRRPDLFDSQVLLDRKPVRARFLILVAASPACYGRVLKRWRAE